MLPTFYTLKNRINNLDCRAELASTKDKIMSKDNIREHSAPVYAGIENAPARSMMRATGFQDADFERPFVGNCVHLGQCHAMQYAY